MRVQTLVSARATVLNLPFNALVPRWSEGDRLSESKHDETFKVVDRRLFTAEGELRKEVAEQQDREREAASAAAEKSARHAPAPSAGGTAAPAPNAAKQE